MVNFKCEKCGCNYSLGEKFSGQKILCGWCGHVNIAPVVRPPYIQPADTQDIEKSMPDFDGLFTALLEYERSAPSLETASR